jgi:hypothetical protein
VVTNRASTARNNIILQPLCQPQNAAQSMLAAQSGGAFFQRDCATAIPVVIIRHIEALGCEVNVMTIRSFHCLVTPRIIIGDCQIFSESLLRYRIFITK